MVKVNRDIQPTPIPAEELPFQAAEVGDDNQKFAARTHQPERLAQGEARRRQMFQRVIEGNCREIIGRPRYLRKTGGGNFQSHLAPFVGRLLRKLDASHVPAQRFEFEELLPGTTPYIEQTALLLVMRHRDKRFEQKRC